MKNKGFTLIELLAVIVILAIIAVITIVSVNSTINSSRQKLTKAQKSAIEDAARKYYIEKGTDDIDCVNLSTLIDDGYIETSKVKDPSTGKEMTGSVKIEYESNQYTYEYQTDKCVIAENFSTDSWETIVAAFEDGSYVGVYNLEDTKQVDMGDLGTHTVRIANLSRPDECDTTGYSQTACGVVIEFVDIITTHNMNSTLTNVGGYPASELHTYIINTIFPALPSDLQSVIIPTYTVSSHGSSDSNNFTSTEQLYLLAPTEVYGSSFTSSYDSARTLTRQLDYYSENEVTTSNYSLAIKKSNGTAESWLLRSADSSYTSYFFGVGTVGNWGDDFYAKHAYGVTPAFRLNTGE